MRRALIAGVMVTLYWGCMLDRAGQLSSRADGGGDATTDAAVGGAGGVAMPIAASSVSSTTSAATSVGGNDASVGGSDGAGGAGGAALQIEQAGELLVALDAEHASAGTATWLNEGTLGDFVATGAPTKGTYQGSVAVEFDGNDDAYVGPTAPSSIVAGETRSIEVWACNPALNPEETLVAWGNRGGPTSSNLTFNYGDNSTYGAVGHWADDMGWGVTLPPAADAWHHLVYTYDGTDAVVYADTVEKNRRPTTLVTHVDFSINIAAQREGTITFNQAGSLWVAVVRVHSEALTAGQIAVNFALERDRFGL